MNINFSGRYILQCGRAEKAAGIACGKMQETYIYVQKEIDEIMTNQSGVNQLQTDIFEKQKDLDQLSKKPFKTSVTYDQIAKLQIEISEKQKEINKKQIIIQQNQLALMQLRNLAYILNGSELSDGKDHGRGEGAKILTNKLVDIYGTNNSKTIDSGLESFDASDYRALRDGLKEAYRDVDNTEKKKLLAKFDRLFMIPVNKEGNKVIDLT
jgi:hypothetical protein